MPTKKTETTPDTAEMNVWSKLLAARHEFYVAGAKKTGINSHAEFKYFELADIVPLAEPIFTKYGLLLQPTFTDGCAIANLINVEKPNEIIQFSIPLIFIAEPAKFRMNEVQGVGAAVTYYRRYLYMIVLDLIEADNFDGETPKKEDLPQKPATPQERVEIKKNLTTGQADDMQIKALKAALKKLKELDPGKEEFIQEVALKTEGFKKISKSACEKLILKISDMLKCYGGES